MQTVLDILKRAGGWHPGLSLKIENQPFMSLVIEAMDESGPCGLPALSVAHYGEEQNGDPTRDPEMCFELAAANVELSLLGVLAFLENDDVVRPSYFSHKLCEFFVLTVRLVKVPHSPEI